MALISWPSILPRPLTKNYSYQQQETIIATNFGSGRSRHTRKASRVPEAFSCSVFLSDSELAIFESWVFYKLKDVNWFLLKIKTASECADRKVRLTKSGFVKKYNHDFSRWEISFVIVSELQKYMTDDRFDTYVAAGNFGDLVALKLSPLASLTVNYGTVALDNSKQYFSQFGDWK